MPDSSEALPATTIDLITDGVSPGDLKRAGGRAVWNALVKTACSAIQHGWDQMDWEALVLSPRRQLGHQIRLPAKGAERTRVQIHKMLTEAWEAADKFVEANPRTGSAAARETAAYVMDWLSSTDCSLDANPRKILVVAAASALERGTDRPALPMRMLEEQAGLGLTAVRTALRRLEEDRLLTLAVRGRPGKPGGKTPPRANLYRLPTRAAINAYVVRETRSVVPPSQSAAKVCDAPLVKPARVGAKVCDAPRIQTSSASLSDQTDLEALEVTVSIMDSKLDAVLAALAELSPASLRAGGPDGRALTEAPGLSCNVIQLSLAAGDVDRPLCEPAA